ncbi:MAG: methyltransferase domain-containing protein [Sulfuricurvum sp.]|jgi:malonyl-CoA O-methyltransferase|uniref:methyltransferase domain-containing protein n=1 Tax=Sulfuricurvum sp. TaxID=2025608 RepID=UPI0025F0F962|nr:methyltransferase domain-containing protein [Sulfuricurvum sp.]MCK9374440.1 methyltransferase domain-containing protein [Sulfuricurvum sp.]
MRVCEEFSRYAAQYGMHNVIQAKVAQKLVADTDDTPKKILDLGCGNGTLFSQITWNIEYFTGVDFSESMLEHHPNPAPVTLMLGDFNDPSLFDKLSRMQYDRIYSASALQWSNDLNTVFKSISDLLSPVSLALFTSGTFETLYKTAGLSPILKSADEVIEIANRHFKAEYEIIRYVLEFESVREMFRYIKRSGVSGGRRVLDVAQTKALMREYPLNYLEFEVVFIAS